jgi:hypothetical protein
MMIALTALLAMQVADFLEDHAGLFATTKSFAEVYEGVSIARDKAFGTAS